MSLRTKLGIDLDVDSSGVGKGLSSTESKFSRLGGIGKKAGLALAGGLGLAAVGAVKLAQAAAEDEAGQKRLAKVIQNVTGARGKDIASVEDWITRQGQALGVADDDLRPALGRLVAATGDVTKAQQLAGLAMDVSAGTGKSLEAVTTALAKAQNGSVGGLSRLGVATKNAAGETLSLDTITQNLAKTYQGSAATAADTAAGRFGRLKLQLGEMGENIGAKLLPAATSVLGWVNKMLPRGEALAGTIGQKIGPAFRAVAGFITDKVVPAGQQVFQWYMEKIAPGLQRTLAPVLAGVKSVFAKVTDAVRDNRESLGKLWSAAKTIAEFVATKLAPVLGEFAGGTLKVLGAAIGGTIRTIAFLIDKFSSAYQWAKNLAASIREIAHELSSVKLGAKTGFGVGLGSAIPGLGGLVNRSVSAPVSRLAPSVAASPTSQVVELNVTVQGNLIDPAGAARAIRQLLLEAAGSDGTLAIGVPL